MDDFQGFSNGGRRGKRAKIQGAVLLQLPNNGQIGIGILDVQPQARIALVIFQDHVVPGPMPLDEVRLKDERFLLGIGQDRVKGGNLPDQETGF